MINKVNPLRVLWMLPLAGVMITLLGVLISVVYFTVAYFITTKLIMKRRPNILKAIIVAVAADIPFVLLRTFLLQGGYVTAMVVNLVGLAYAPLCAALAMMGGNSVAVETLQLWCERMLATGAIDPEAYQAYRDAM